MDLCIQYSFLSFFISLMCHIEWSPCAHNNVKWIKHLDFLFLFFSVYCLNLFFVLCFVAFLFHSWYGDTIKRNVLSLSFESFSIESSKIRSNIKRLNEKALGVRVCE